MDSLLKMPDCNPLRCLHQQAEAEIFLCIVRPSRELVVVKKIYLDSLPSAESTRAPNVEAAIVSKLLRHGDAHVNVLRYSAINWQPDAVLLTMEYCPHGDLLSWLEQQPDNRFHEAVALRIFAQALRGVQFLHALGIAHRDLSLENLLVGKDQVIKLCDFGLATPTACRPSNEIVGKPNYMAPEVLASEWYDPMRADLWSLGVVLFILLTGSPLFGVADTSDATFRAFETLGVAGVLRHWRMDHTVSAATQDLLTQLLSVDPSKRCPSAEEALARLPTEV